jgi:hypothetical protein
MEWESNGDLMGLNGDIIEIQWGKNSEKTIGLVLHPPTWKNWVNKYSGKKKYNVPPLQHGFTCLADNGLEQTLITWGDLNGLYLSYVGFLKSGTTI